MTPALLRFFSTAITGLLLAGASQAQSPQSETTAFRALFIAGKSADGTELAGISGVRGEPQPQSWKFLYLDPLARGGIREIVVSRGQVESTRTPLRGYTEIAGRAPINPTKLSIDSDRAFQIANTEAIRAKIAFHWIDYSLDSQDSSQPVWRLKMFDRLGIPLASMSISAQSGSIVSPLRVDSTVRDDRTETTRSEPIGGLIGDVRDLGIGIGKAVSDTVLRTVGTGQEILTGERTIGPSDDE